MRIFITLVLLSLTFINLLAGKRLDLVGLGYNVYTGNPLYSTQLDPGIMDQVNVF